MTSSPQSSNSDEGIDHLLRDYYRTKMPREFPPLPLETAEPSRSPRQASLSRGRLILAACVAAVLLGFGYLLATGPRIGPNPVGFGADNSATNLTPHGAPKGR